MVTAILLVGFAFFISQCAAIDRPGSIIVHPPTYSTSATSQTVRMTCVAYGTPFPSVVWGRANVDISSMINAVDSPYKQYDKTVIVNGTSFAVSVLEICNVEITMTDEYSCTADNGVYEGMGITDSEVKFFLSVSGASAEPAAVIVRPPSDNSTVDYGSTIEAVCVAYGNPVPTISWTRDDTCGEISCIENANVFSETVQYGDVTFRKSILQLCNVTERNSGSFTCSAMNGISGRGVAAQTASWTLTVNPKPLDITISTTTTTTTTTIPITTTTSCPSMMVTTTTTITKSQIPSTSVTRTVGKMSGQFSSTGEQIIYQGTVAGLAVVIVILLVVAVIAIIIAIKARSDSRKAEIAAPPRDKMVTAVENPIHKDQDVDANLEGDEKDDDTVTYANLVRKMEAEDNEDAD